MTGEGVVAYFRSWRLWEKARNSR